MRNQNGIASERSTRYNPDRHVYSRSKSYRLYQEATELARSRVIVMRRSLRGATDISLKWERSIKKKERKKDRNVPGCSPEQRILRRRHVRHLNATEFH